MPHISMPLPRTLLSFLISLLVCSFAHGQTCTALGQTPATAFPVCGTTIFQQATVPICSTHAIQVPGCDSRQSAYADANPYWYRFTCFEAGTLGFTITPNNLGDDYDWQLYDVTGHSPNDVFTNISLVVTGNWSGTFGITGAKSGGLSTIQCGSDPKEKKPTFSAMPNLIKGHNYLLLISHYTNSQSGYSLLFSGGTASITDPGLPMLKDLHPNCAGNQLILRITKRTKCSSLAADGSDFTIDAPGVSVVSATAPACTDGFDMDSIVITLNKDLVPGNYNLSVKNGTDENTLLDNCDNAIAAGASLPLVVEEKQPTPFDSLAPVSCAPQVLEFVFKRPIQCSSIAADGSDFFITGTHTYKIDAAYGNCQGDEGVSTSVFVHFTQPIVLAGTYTVTTTTGIDGNVIVDECGEATPAAQSVSFSVKDTVSAAFTAMLKYGCMQDTINVLHDGNHGVNNWQWTFTKDIVRTGQTSQAIYSSYGEKNIMLVVSNGFCSDTASTTINLDNELKANFTLPDIACPNEAVAFTDTSIGNIILYQWNFGNGNQSQVKAPPQQVYPQATGDRIYPVKLLITNNLHCTDTITKELFVAYSCHIAVPSAFTPNGDGLNDYLYPVNAYKADNLMFVVYNRLGQKVFETRDRKARWDGRVNGQLQSAATYVWMLQYTNHDTGQLVSVHGTAVLIR